MVLNIPLTLSVLVVRRGALSMLESTLRWGSVASVLLLLWWLLAVVVAGAALLWLLGILLVVALVIALCGRGAVALAWCWRTVLVWWGILLLAVALVVLVVRSGHCGCCVGAVGNYCVGTARFKDGGSGGRGVMEGYADDESCD